MRLVPRGGLGAARPAAGRAVRHHRPLRGRRDRRRRRELRPRVDPQSPGPPRPGLPGDHADLSGPPQRGERHAADRVSEDPAARGRGGDAMIPQTEPLVEPHATEPRVNYLTADYGIRSWLFTVDHKRIALLYLISITVMFVIGGLFAGAIRLELLTPQADVVNSDTYNKLFTMHGVVMIFFFLIPSIPAVLGNFLIPLMIGARDLAFPRINLLSWYIYTVSAVIGLWVMVAGGVDTGWTFYTPYSTAASATYVIP